MTDNFRIVPYREEHRKQWDECVQHSRNATFIMQRDFMEYHADRFVDASLMIYRKDKLVAVMPANSVGETIYSHQGLTYSGVAMAITLHGNEIVELFKEIQKHLIHIGYRHLVYKPIPHIYHRIPSEDELYALHQLGATVMARTLSSACRLANCTTYSSLRKRGIKRAKQAGLICTQSDHWEEYWELLTNNLQQRHLTQPVHNINEITKLHRLFPNNIQLYTAQQNGKIEAGVVLFRTETCHHAQYIAASQTGRSNGALDLLFDYLINHARQNTIWFDFGISTEQQGTLLNHNLLLQKEGFGARGIIYDTYSLNLQNG